MRILVYGDSNSWGTSPHGTGLRFADRWPVVMGRDLGAEVIENALPGRTTCHDDAQMHGAAQNGLAHLPVALLASQPVDLLLIMLGTNDLKARFAPNAARIAGHLMGLVGCARDIGGGPGPWGESGPPRIGLIVPAPLPAHVDDPAWDRVGEWAGARVASLGLGDALRDVAGDVPVFEAGDIVAGDPADPIHFGEKAHVALGHAVADWVRGLG